MKYLLVLVILGGLGAFIYLRLRPYIELARRFFSALRQAQRLSRGSAEPARQSAPASTTKAEKLVRCTTCGTWLPATRALVFRATNTTYCSPACLERAAARTEPRKSANGRS